MTHSHTRILRISKILWVIWGIVHAMAGILILSGDPTAGFQAIADAVPANDLVVDYPAAVGGVLNQHAWNLAWFGFATIIGGAPYR